MQLHYGLSCDADALFDSTLRRVASTPNVRRVCEIGGGANPALDIDFVREHDLKYTIADISAEELEKAPAGYHKVQADISRPDHGISDRFDLVFSVWCAEHVPDGEAFHRHVFDLLDDGGIALHLFPTMYSPPFVVNRLMPESFSNRVLQWFQPHREPDGNHAKFPAYYQWCRGPSTKQIRRLKNIGFEVEEYNAFFGHSGRVAFGAGYLDRVAPLCQLHERICQFLLRHPVPSLTTIAFVVLRKPTACMVSEYRLRDENCIPEKALASLECHVYGSNLEFSDRSYRRLRAAYFTNAISSAKRNCESM